MKLCWSHGINYPKLINSVDVHNDNGLHIAASSGKIDIVVFLIEELKMDPAVENRNGVNVISMARRNGNMYLTQYLTEKIKSWENMKPVIK